MEHSKQRYDKQVTKNPPYKFSNRYYYAEVYNVLEKLAESVARPGMIGVDIGCLDGSSAWSMLPVVKREDGTAYLVDWFRGSPDTVVGADWRMDNFPTGEVIFNLLENLRIDGFDKMTLVVAALSDWAATIVADGAVDYCFIAADHRYTQARRDIVAWAPKIRPGGVIAGHAFETRVESGTEDWQTMMNNCEHDLVNNAHYGVIRAVQECFDSFEVEAGVWWTRKL